MEFLAHLQDDNSTFSLITLVIVVWELLEAFPNNLPSMPSDHDFEFCVNSKLATHFISISPYRMASNDLSKLKYQLQELLGEGFYSFEHFSLG